MFRAREALKKEFNKYLKLLVFTSNLDGRLILYLNKNIPLSAYCDSASLSKDVSLKSIQIYADTKVKDENGISALPLINIPPIFPERKHK